MNGDEVKDADWVAIIIYLSTVQNMSTCALARCMGIHRNQLYHILKRQTKMPRRYTRACLWNLLTVQIGHDLAENFKNRMGDEARHSEPPCSGNETEE